MQIEANGITLDYAETGPEDGPALILIRGLGSQRIHWPATLTDGFAGAGFRVVTFDNRDIGRSSRCPSPGVRDTADQIAEVLARGETPAAAYALSDMAADVIGLMDTLGIDRAHVLGISMGGGIAQILATEHAARLRSATIVMSSAHFSPDRIGAVLAHLASRDVFVDAAVEAERAWRSPGYPRPEADVRREAALAFDRGAEADGVNRQALATATAGDRRGALRRIDLPCLVIHGVDDALVPVAAGREIADLIPGAEFEAVAGMGHVITPALAPHLVARTTRFIAERAG